jgi:hypothetical protein
MPYGPRLSEDELFSRARERIKEGRLPLVLSKDLIAGDGGSGDMCCVCDQEILSAHVQYELIDPRDSSQLTFHLACHAVWQLECVRYFREGPPDSDSLIPGLLKRIQP